MTINSQARSGRLVEDLLFCGLDFIVRSVFEVLDVLGVEGGEGGRHDRRGLAAALQDLELAQAALEPLAAAAQRLVDRLRRGSEAPLQNGEGKADRSGAFVVLQTPRRD